MQKKWIGLACGLLAAGMVLAGCGNGAGSAGEVSSTAPAAVSSQESKAPAEESTISSTAPVESGEETIQVGDETVKIDRSGPALAIGDQLELPKKGEEIAVIETTQGTIQMRLFPQAAPYTVANFKKLAKDGVYNGCPFHRIIDGFMIQTGRVNGTSIYGESFQDEFSEALLNLRGAVSMANSSRANTNGTQFFINQTPAAAFEGWENILNGYRAYMQSPTEFTQIYGSWPDMSKVTMEIRELYEENGGNPSLDGAYTTTGLGHTVFGQVFSGMDVVDKIAQAETDANDAPVTSDDYKIVKITFAKYKG